MDSYSWLHILRPFVHYGLHFLFPAVIGLVFFKQRWKYAWFIMVLTMLIDLDHLFAAPIFDPQRCSINFHFLHTYYAMIVYAGMLFFNPTRIAGAGLSFHILTDFQDCLWM